MRVFLRVFWLADFLLILCSGRPQTGLFLNHFSAGFTQPTCIANAGDNRLFVTEQAGLIRIADSLGNIKPLPFLDISDRVNSALTEQGLLGLAFHPEFQSNGYFYVNYTGTGDSTHISRFSVSLQNADSAVAASEKKLMTIYQPYTNHNGGDLQFGTDGFLYIGMGDGGSVGDPENRAQDSLQLLGKMLRIDVDNGDPYAIPVTNPFYDHTGVRQEIWALGMRNPWRFSFDRATGDLWIGDVGQNMFEEIDYQPAASAGGENYGWRCYEGDTVYNQVGCGTPDHYTFPLFTYRHESSDPCNSVTGGYVYRGSKYPPMSGRYYFADYCTNDLWSIRQVSGSWTISYLGRFGSDNLSTFGEDVHGELYAAARTSGIIYQVADTSVESVPTIEYGSISVQPNPFRQIVSISILSYYRSTTNVNLLNIQGKMIRSYEIREKKTALDLGFLDPGLYLLEIRQNGQTFYRKLIKQ